MGVILTLICGVFSEELISCVIDSEGIREYGTPLVRTLLLSGPVMGILFIYINTLQAIGAEAAQPVADILSLLLAVWLFWRTEKRMGKAPSFVELKIFIGHYLSLSHSGLERDKLQGFRH